MKLGGDSIKYKNPYMRKAKNTHPLLVSCNKCKTDLLVYQKGGRGNLIKLQVYRIIESDFDLDEAGKGLVCFNCGQQLGALRDYKGEPTYYLIRGRTRTKRLEKYRY